MCFDGMCERMFSAGNGMVVVMKRLSRGYGLLCWLGWMGWLL